MKVFNKLASALMVLPMLAALTACNETAEYTPGESDASKYEIPRFVSFSSADLANNNFELEEGESSFMVTLLRDSIAGELTVGLTIEQTTEGALSIPESVTFPDSVQEVTFNVNYDAAAILAKGGMSDTVSIKIKSDEFTPDFSSGEYKFIAKLFPMTAWCSTPAEFAAAGGKGDFPLTKTQDQTTAATGTYTYTQYWSGTDPNLPVFFRQNTENPKKGQFRIEGVFYGVTLLMNAELDGEIWRLDIPECYSGYDHSSYGPLYFSDLVNYGILRTSQGASGWLVTWDEAPSRYVPEEGLFYLYMCAYVGAGTFGYGYEYFQVDGFKPYEASLDEDFKWEEQYVGVFNSNKLKTQSTAGLSKGICVTTTDACDSTFAANYGTAYKIVAPYAEGKDIYFCVNNDGNITLAPGYEDAQPTGLKALDEEVYATINTKASTFASNEVVLNITFTNGDGSLNYGTTDEILQNITWTAKAVGTFTYTFWWEGVDEGYTLSQRDDQPDIFRIEDWGGGIDFMFRWNQTTNVCDVLEQYIGADHPSYGPVYIIEGAEYHPNYAEKHSYYDPETKTFYFYPAYFVEAGSFGQGEESFQITEEAAVKAHKVRKAYKPAKLTSTKRNTNIWKGKKVAKPAAKKAVKGGKKHIQANLTLH